VKVSRAVPTLPDPCPGRQNPRKFLLSRASPEVPVQNSRERVRRQWREEGVSAKNILSALPLSNQPGTSGTVGTPAEIERVERPETEFPDPGHPGQEATPPLDPEPKPIRWIDRPDLVAVVEDLADERWRPGRIAGALGLTRDEVITILRRTGR
jgi:hypothetical protein